MYGGHPIRRIITYMGPSSSSYTGIRASSVLQGYNTSSLPSLHRPALPRASRRLRRPMVHTGYTPSINKEASTISV